MKSYSQFIKYFNLNEISKFSNINNIYLFSNIKYISVWFSLDLSFEKSRLIFYSKGLVGIFLIYLITNKFPLIQSSKDQRIVYIESNLVSLGLVEFLEKFLIIYSSKQKKKLFKDCKLGDNFLRFFITDLNLFIELDNFINFFGIIDCIYIDIFYNSKSKNNLLFDNLFQSSL